MNSSTELVNFMREAFPQFDWMVNPWELLSTYTYVEGYTFVVKKREGGKFAAEFAPTERKGPGCITSLPWEHCPALAFSNALRVMRKTT